MWVPVKESLIFRRRRDDDDDEYKISLDFKEKEEDNNAVVVCYSLSWEKAKDNSFGRMIWLYSD